MIIIEISGNYNIWNRKLKLLHRPRHGELLQPKRKNRSKQYHDIKVLFVYCLHEKKNQIAHGGLELKNEL